MKQKVIVVGAGFAGIHLARNLDQDLFDVLLIDKLNHHQFQPLFYQVAAAQIEPSSISFPIRHIFKTQANVQIRMAEVLEINPNQKTITTDIGTFDFDILAIAIGCTTNFFGNSNIEKYALKLKSSSEAIAVRHRILETFEKLLSADESEKEALQNLVIVGAGPTGVELAGAFAEIKSNILSKDYHGADFSNFKITLIEGSPNTLNNMSDTAKKASRQYLQQMGIAIIPNTFVKDYNGTELFLNNDTIIKTKIVIWAAGVIGNTINGIPKHLITSGNRIKVDRYNQVLNLDGIYAIGDISYMESPLYPKGHPQVANVAINQAKLLSKNLKLKQNQKTLKTFEYHDLGSMATIGRNKAVVDFPFFHFKGYVAWLIWMFLHLMLILSVKNKIIIFVNWAWSYLTKDSSHRLIYKM
jgi:NADH dehydrogenase